MPSDLLTADLSLLPARTLPEPLPRLLRTDDLNPLAWLYLIIYPSRIGSGKYSEVLSEIAATFEGDYGVLCPGASLVAEAGGRLAGAVLTVERSIWDEGLEGPFIIDLFVDPQLRSRGIGRALMTGVMLACRNAGDAQLSLRVGKGPRMRPTFSMSRWDSGGPVPRRHGSGPEAGSRSPGGVACFLCGDGVVAEGAPGSH